MPRKIMATEEVWFSHNEEVYEIKKGKFKWTGKKRIWNWDHCIISLAKPSKDKTLVVVRSKTNKNSRYMGNKPIKIRFMLGFEVEKPVSVPSIEKPKKGKGKPKKGEWDGPRDRYVLQLRGRPSSEHEWNNDYWIWVFDDNDKGKKNVDKLYKRIDNKIKSKKVTDKIFEVDDVSTKDKIIPVIYQPAVDSLRNFVREVHCKKKTKAGIEEIEVTLIFENEHLQKNEVIDRAYKFARKDILFGREKDIETFKIIVENNKPKHLVFQGIYSKEKDKNGNCVERNLFYHSTHGDQTKKEEDVPPRPIVHCFMSDKHPIVFINTSNHAMAEDDANHRLWKWEYVPWEEDSTVDYGTNSREEVEKMFPPPPFWGIPKFLIFDLKKKLKSKSSKNCLKNEVE